MSRFRRCGSLPCPDRGISSGLRLIANRNKKDTQIRFPLGALGRNLLSAGPTLDCNSCHRQGLVHQMELPIGEQRNFALGV